MKRSQLEREHSDFSYQGPHLPVTDVAILLSRSLPQFGPLGESWKSSEDTFKETWKELGKKQERSEQKNVKQLELN